MRAFIHPSVSPSIALAEPTLSSPPLLPIRARLQSHSLTSSSITTSTRRCVRLYAESGNNGFDKDERLDQFVNDSGFFFWVVALADFLVLFLFFDAGYSGDWVRYVSKQSKADSTFPFSLYPPPHTPLPLELGRIGAITLAQEALARKLAVIVSVLHCGTGYLAVTTGRERELPVSSFRLLAEGWLFGAVGLIRAQYLRKY